MSHALVSYTVGKLPQPSDEFHKLLHPMAVNFEKQSKADDRRRLGRNADGI